MNRDHHRGADLPVDEASAVSCDADLAPEQALRRGGAETNDNLRTNHRRAPLSSHGRQALISSLFGR